MEFRPPLIDLLSQKQPHGTNARPLSSTSYLQSVKRDVIELLNTTNLEWDVDFSDAPDVEKSTINFGLPPLVGSTITALQTQEFQLQVKQVLETFEPRLDPASIQVSVMSERDRLDQIESVTLRVEAEVYLDPAPLHLVLESSLGIQDGRLYFEL